MTGGIRIDKNVPVAMRDGTVLRADIWRPADELRHPVLVQRTPYRKELSGSDDWLRLELAIPHGYVVVVQDVRGRFASDGVWGAMKPEGWQQEALDTYDTTEWAARQLWSDGNVGLYGCSYLGALAILGATLRPPHLKAIAPAFISSEERAHLDTGGAFLLKQWITYHLRMAADQLMPLVKSGAIASSEADRIRELARDPSPILEHLPLEDSPHFDSPALPVSLRELLRNSDIGLPQSFAFEDLEVPVLVIGGWYDLYPARTVESFRRLHDASTDLAHRLLFGPWAHSVPTGIQGDVDFGGGAAAIASAHPAQLAFFDRHLRGFGGEDDTLPVRYFLMGANEWRDAENWPPAGTHLERWYLDDGKLSRAQPTSLDGCDTFRYDPAEPVPTIGGRVGFVGGPRDQSRLDKREDVLLYSSASLLEPIDIVGQVTLSLTATSDVADTDFVARLVDLQPDGAAMLISSGLARARYRKGFDREVPLEPGIPECYKFELGPTAIRIKPGHRLGLYIGCSDFPWSDRNMNTGNALGVDAAGIVATQTVLRNRAHPSWLDIDVMPLASSRNSA